MTKQEQIKEMGQIICERSKDGICLLDKTSCDSICGWAIQAEAIYNAGYKKLPKDAVILTKEEYIDLSRNYVKEQKTQAVNEFAEKLKERCHNYYPSIDHYCCSEKAVNVKDIDELLKEFRNDR